MMRIATRAGSIFAALLAVTLAGSASATDDTLKIYLMIGQSNMEGQAYAYHIPQTGPGTWNVPTIEDFIDRPATLDALPDSVFTFANQFSSDWLDNRDDVWATHYRSDNGGNLPVKNGTSEPAGGWETGVQPLQPGFGLATSPFAGLIGAEFAMGHRLGEALDSPILLFKSSKGGTDLAFNWRPPSAVADRGGSVGTHYNNTVNQFKAQLDTLDADLGDDGLLNNYNNATGYEVAGIVWLQGWNTTNGSNHGGLYPTAAKIAEYADNFEDLIEDIRASDSRIANDTPVVLVESSDQSASLNTERQAAVDMLNADIPGSAVFLETNGLKGVNYSSDGVTNVDGNAYNNGWGFHFHARAENFLEIGWKVAGAVLDNGFTGSSPVYGDFNGDMLVDMADYTLWRNNLGADRSVLSAGSTMMGTGAIDATDYQTWKDNFGADYGATISGSQAVAVPEPTSCLLLGAGALILLLGVRRK